MSIISLLPIAHSLFRPVDPVDQCVRIRETNTLLTHRRSNIERLRLIIVICLYLPFRRLFTASYIIIANYHRVVISPLTADT